MPFFRLQWSVLPLFLQSIEKLKFQKLKFLSEPNTETLNEFLSVVQRILAHLLWKTTTNTFKESFFLKRPSLSMVQLLINGAAVKHETDQQVHRDFSPSVVIPQTDAERLFMSDYSLHKFSCSNKLLQNADLISNTQMIMKMTLCGSDKDEQYTCSWSHYLL